MHSLLISLVNLLAFKISALHFSDLSSAKSIKWNNFEKFAM